MDANLVYQEYIRDRHHVHLSGTRWKSLAGFVRFLGHKGVAEVKQKRAGATDALDDDSRYMLSSNNEQEESDSESEDEDEDEVSHDADPSKRPKWLIKLVDKSPEAILAAKSKSAAARKTADEHSLQAKEMAMTERAAVASASGKSHAGTAPVVVVKKATAPQSMKPPAAIFASDDDDGDGEATLQTSVASFAQKRSLVLDEMAAEEAHIKRPALRQNSYATAPIEIPIEPDADVGWIRKGLLIRIGNREVGDGRYVDKLAVIDEVMEEFGAQVVVLESGDQLLLDQDDCVPVATVADEEYDAQLRHLDQKLLSTALKTDRCIIVARGHVGQEGRRVSQSAANDGRKQFSILVTELGTSQIHRVHLTLFEGDFCMFWE